MNTIAVPTIFKISVIEEEGPNFDLQCQYVAILCYRKFNTWRLMELRNMSLIIDNREVAKLPYQK